MGGVLIAAVHARGHDARDGGHGFRRAHHHPRVERQPDPSERKDAEKIRLKGEREIPVSGRIPQGESGSFPADLLAESAAEKIAQAFDAFRADRLHHQPFGGGYGAVAADQNVRPDADRASEQERLPAATEMLRELPRGDLGAGEPADRALRFKRAAQHDGLVTENARRSRFGQAFLHKGEVRGRGTRASGVPQDLVPADRRRGQNDPDGAGQHVSRPRMLERFRMICSATSGLFME